VLRVGRREPPPFPPECLGDFWAYWVLAVAEGASAPVDYTGSILLAVAATLIGNARWVSPWRGWSEPPFLWVGNVGDPSSGKSPAADPLITIVRRIEKRSAKDFAGQLKEWKAAVASATAHRKNWEKQVRKALADGNPAPPMPAAAVEPPMPHCARIVTSDTTIEELGAIEAKQAKGFAVLRDELSGWYASLGRYSRSDADRAFWVEGYGGRPYKIDRVRLNGAPIEIERHCLGLFGAITPDRLVEMLESPDDGLTSRILWSWPNKVPARRPNQAADINVAAVALQLLWELPLVTADDPDQENAEPQSSPFYCNLSKDAAEVFTEWWVNHHNHELVGPLAGPKGKMPGHVLRLALVLEHLWWCGAGGIAFPPENPPATIGEKAVTAAIVLCQDYFAVMAERVFGDAAVPEADRLASVLARYIYDRRDLKVLNARSTRRNAGLPGLRDSEKMSIAIDVMVEADWLVPAPTRAGGTIGRRRADWLINPRLRTGA
jgi:hypothetical protein